MDSFESVTARPRRYQINTSLSPTISTAESHAFASPPFTRDSSPSPSLSPSPALSPCPPLGRSFSAASSASTFSRQSATSRSSSASAALRQRGYVRPQGATFAASASNRDSVLSLGSIAHLQYYFARTGLLDGKGGQMARETKKTPAFSDGLLTTAPTSYAGSEVGSVGDDTGLASADDTDSNHFWDDALMLPPTVSTYSHRNQFLPPPPDSGMLRTDLKGALLDAGRALHEVQDHNAKISACRKDSEADQVLDDSAQTASPPLTSFSGWHEIQGLHILDVVTLAIRAAKIFYTTHENPQRLYSIRSERRLRDDLFSVLDILKRMGGRNFVGGMKEEEVNAIQGWVQDIDKLIAEEQAVEIQESRERERLKWLEGAWTGREREREWLFLCSFLPERNLPEWKPLDENHSEASPFLQSLQSGLVLVQLQNAILKKSKRQFGDIKSFHTDTGKPYRCAENLRYWIKSVEIRWEIKLKVDVTGVVHFRPDAWHDFDTAIFQWSRTAREELTKEWKEGSVRISIPVSSSPCDEPAGQA